MATSPPATIHDEWLTALLAAETVEPAACAVMRRILEVVQSQPRAQNVRRVLIHARPGGAYRTLLSLPAGRTEPELPRDGRQLLPSLTAWRAVECHGRPVAVDVTTAELVWLSPNGEENAVEERIDGGQSRVRLMSRDTTHVLVIPLRTAYRSVAGMLAIEANDPEAAGAPLSWGSALNELERIAALAGPVVLSLPSGSEETEVEAPDPLLPVVGRELGQTLRVLELFARQNETLLIRGPTGAGKSRLARWCHTKSKRKNAPYEVVDLLAIPQETQMAELFGWEKGAFTGAARRHEGFVARAAGGTLFIDEVDKLSLAAQAGLLSLLEERTYRPLGHEGQPIDADVRFVVGTNADLENLVAEGRFREDLYYRIDVLPVRLPALAERRDEIAGWANFMLERRHAESEDPSPAAFEAGALGLLEEQPWPGNLRQLDNIVRRSYLHALVGGATPVVVHRTHVSRALDTGSAASNTPNSSSAPLMSAYRAAAAAFLEYARSRSPDEKGLDLDWSKALAGFVLERGQAAGMAVDEVFEMVGRHNLVRTRNHHRVLRREAERVGALLELVGETPDETMQAFLRGRGDQDEQ